MTTIADLRAQHACELNPLLQRIANGGVTLFLGSGFSADAIGLDDVSLGTGSALAKSIGNLGKFDPEGDLRYAADRYMDEHDTSSLVDLLLRTFTVKQTREHHLQIGSAPWRRTYTTNYDLCFEKASEQQGLLVQTVDIDAPPSEFSAKRSICVHLNGSIKNLNTTSLNHEFKLSTSSYLDPKSFLESRWNYAFQRDLEFSSAIVFVGYSMYDIEIQKILHANSHYKEKTFFITSTDIREKDRFTLSKFGTILPITGAGLGAAIADTMAAHDSSTDVSVLASISLYELNEESKEARDSDVDTFLMRGEISDPLIDAAITGAKGAPLLINRTALTEAAALAATGANVVVTADFGNGKSVFLKCLRSMLTISGHAVYTVDDVDTHQHDDLEKLVSSGTHGYLIVDTYDKNMDLLKHYAELDPPNLKLILGARTSNHERARGLLTSSGIHLHELSLDELDNGEISEFIAIGDNAGFWGDKAALPEHVKFDIVAHDHRRQLSLTLLALLSAPQMISRVKALLAGLLDSPRRRDTVFAIGLLSAMDSPLTSSLISEIALNNEIFSSDFRNDSSFKQLFRLEGSRLKTKSSLFAVAMISHQFPATFIVDQMLRIVSSIGDSRGEAQEIRDVQKNLLRFSVVERFLPENKRKTNLVRYYESVKREVSWLKSDPHFWLQYGMAQLTYKDFEKAQAYFDQAYSLAARKHNYHTVQIDTQQARLYLFRSTEENTPAASAKLFAEAHQLLRKVPNDVHKFRQVELYKKVFDTSYPSYSGSAKAVFEQACRAQLDEVTKLVDEPDYGFGSSRLPQRVQRTLTEILDAVRASRGH